MGAPKPRAPAIRLVIAAMILSGTAEAQSLRTVVLDPGHGAEDLGVETSDGMNESEIAMDICRRIARTFEARLGIQRVVFTRRKGQNPPIGDRTSIANGAKGDVFVSVHVSHSPLASASGVRVYAMSPELRVVELAERRLRPRSFGPVTGEGRVQGDVRLTPWALAQREIIPRSRALGVALARELPGGEPRVTELPMAVLAGARMPAVLVEIGHAGNSEDAALLNKGSHRQRIAEAIFRGIVSFTSPVVSKSTPTTSGPGSESSKREVPRSGAQP